jgi:hypothetical protein
MTMSTAFTAMLGVVLSLAASRLAAADDQPSPPPDAPAAAPASDADAERDARLQRLEDELAQLREDNAFLEQKVDSATRLSARFSGYLDVGFFATDGDGAGTRTDLGNVYFPRYAGVVPDSWVFLGDPLSTAVNARGEPADTGESRALTFDPIDSRGKSTFIVNALNLGLLVGLGDSASLVGSVDFVPRGRDISDPLGHAVGDYVDVKLAYGEWRPGFERVSLALQAGKFDSVVGREYRSLESPDRTTVTPSLICRYTCGRPLGVKARLKLLDEALVANVSVTNGSHATEGFPLSDEIDRNQWKTAAGRLSYLAVERLELGVSGAVGAQDLQTGDDVLQWHLGGDLHVDWKDFELTAELVKGRANGETSPMAPRCDVAPCIRYTGAYGLLSHRLTNELEPFARVDWRDAVHESGASFVYISQLVRYTLGLRSELGAHVVVKAEATLNRELGRLPQFPNNVFTTSLILKY